MYHQLVDPTAKGFAFRYVGTNMSTFGELIFIFTACYRQRYWLRSYLGYPPVRDAKPNTSHFALAALQYAGLVPHVITQNVDGLHHKSLALSNTLSPVKTEDAILELHGTLHVFPVPPSTPYLMCTHHRILCVSRKYDAKMGI